MQLDVAKGEAVLGEHGRSRQVRPGGRWPLTTGQPHPTQPKSAYSPVGVASDDNSMNETRYRIPAGSHWAVWDDANSVLGFMTDAEVVENARANERQLGDEFAGSPLPADPTPEEAWRYVRDLWAGDPGGRGWQVRVPPGATWLCLRDDEDDPAPGGPEPTFGFGEPPTSEGIWEKPGY